MSAYASAYGVASKLEAVQIRFHPPWNKSSCEGSNKCSSESTAFGKFAETDVALAILQNGFVRWFLCTFM